MLLLVGFLALGSLVSGANWGYGDHNGPSKWAEHYAECAGDAQSPIDIDSVVDTNKEQFPLRWSGYDRTPNAMTLANNGHTLILSSKGPRPELELDSRKFGLDSVHFHWGKTDAEGSEHTLFGKRYTLELHAVHKRLDAQGEYGTTVDIVVVTNLFQVSAEDSDALAGFLFAASLVTKPGTNTSIAGFPWSTLVWESDSNYFKYRGSLTTPPCTQAVTFLVQDKVLPVSAGQMKLLRALLNDDAEEMAGNVRPVQQRNGRVVFHVL